MKVTSILATLSLTSFTVAAPMSLNERGGILPSPGYVIEKMFPHSGIPKIAGKLDKTLNICKSYLYSGSKIKANVDILLM